MTKFTVTAPVVITHHVYDVEADSAASAIEEARRGDRKNRDVDWTHAEAKEGSQ